MRRAVPFVLASAASLAACTSPEEGTVSITMSGGDYAEHGIPAAAFSDGWDVHLDMVMVSIGAAQVASSDDAPVLDAPGFLIFDLHKPDGLAVATFPDAEGSYDELRFTIRPEPTAVTANAGADAIALRNAGASLRIKGTAARGEDLVWFDWSFAKDVTHARCATGGDRSLEITIHPEQLFVDDMVAADPALALDFIASADGADGSALDGTITEAELAATPLAGQARYQVGGLPITDLGAYVAHQAGLVARVNGDDRCLAVVDSAD